MDALKPFVMLASAAFVTGFAGYLAVARVHELSQPAAVPPAAIQAADAVPVTAASWNLGKRI